MKTAISLPDVIYHRATERAVVLGISRSEFFVRAAERYLADLDAASLTDQIDVALEHADDSNAVAAAAGRRRLAETDDVW
ncbi:MAG: hypothetical protein ACRDWT_15900 [Jatrophihabitantaceae bacterium]